MAFFTLTGIIFWMVIGIAILTKVAIVLIGEEEEK